MQLNNVYQETGTDITQSSSQAKSGNTCTDEQSGAKR